METAHMEEVEESGTHGRVADLDGTSLLVTGGPMADKDAFVDRTVRFALAEDRESIHVTASRGYAQVADRLPDSTAVVDCSPTPAADEPRVFDVGSPSDLTGISMPVSECLKQSGVRPVVTFDSVTTLLMYGDESSVFRFLSVLTGQLRRVDGVGLFLLEDGCHEEQTVKTFQQLFDGRVDVESERTRVRGLDGVSPGWTSR